MQRSGAPPETARGVRPVTASAKARADRAKKKDARDFEKAFQCTTNLIGYHINRAEMDRVRHAEKRINQIRVSTSRGLQFRNLSASRSILDTIIAQRAGAEHLEKELRLASAKIKKRPSVKYERADAFGQTHTYTQEEARLAMEGMNYPLDPVAAAGSRDGSGALSGESFENTPWDDTPPESLSLDQDFRQYGGRPVTGKLGPSGRRSGQWGAPPVRQTVSAGATPGRGARRQSPLPPVPGRG
mmetsp:Transcript_2029/g.4749  ORF Transcript_2029/g.4749 Transcript_2029/m.4749 type:complete len:243 (+) Transcript_2029:44-772(+)